MYRSKIRKGYRIMRDGGREREREKRNGGMKKQNF